MRRLSVLHFSNTSLRSGAEEHILTLLRGLDRAYFRLHLVCAPEVARALEPDLPADVELLALRLGRARDMGGALRLAQILRSRRVDILHSHLFYSSLFASPIGWLCRVPIIVETSHARELWRKGWIKSRFFVDRFIGRFVDYYVAVSQANGRYLSEEKGLPPDKIVVIQNGCDIERFAAERPVPIELKRWLGFRDSDPVMVVVGRLEAQKGHRVLLDALPAIRARVPGARLVCVGEGSLRGSLETQVRQLDMEDGVRFVGYQSSIDDWLALADLTVLPSFYEGLPLAAIESLAAGRPVVATSVDGTPEVVVDGQTGLIVPPDQPAPLAEAVCQLLEDQGRREWMGRVGREWVRERFNQERQVRETQRFYLGAWERRARMRPALKVAARVEDQQRPTDGERPRWRAQQS